MKLIFPLFLAMLGMIGLGIWLNTYVPANVVGLLSITGLLMMFFRQPDDPSSLTPEQKKRWYALFLIGLVFSLIFGSFWDTSIGNKG